MNGNGTGWADKDFIGGDLCLDFANTPSGWIDGRPGIERLNAYADLVAWSRHAGTVSAAEARRLDGLGREHPKLAARALERAIRLRETIYTLFAAAAAGHPPPDNALSDLNAALARTLPNLRLVPSGQGFDWGWQEDDDALDRPLWPIVRSAGALLTRYDPTRLRHCPGDDCGWLFVDLSRNGRRRWCDMRICGNRNKAKRHYRKNRLVG